MTNKPFLDCLPEADRTALLDRLTFSSHKRGEYLIDQNDTSRDVFFMIEGHARPEIFSEEGKSVSYRDIAPGAIFGELSAIDGAPRSAYIVAVDNVKIGRLSQIAFQEMVETTPTILWTLLRYLAGQSRAMTERIFEYSTMLTRERLVHELLRIAEAAEPNGRSAKIRPAPTHSDLAARISSHREAVSRQMSRFSKAGITSKPSTGQLIINVDALRALRNDHSDMPGE